jgi:hypothetical protein
MKLLLVHFHDTIYHFANNMKMRLMQTIRSTHIVIVVNNTYNF